MTPTSTVIRGDIREVADKLPRGAVQTIVTSPPYYRQRDYGHDAQLGNESTPAEYVSNLVAVFRSLANVLTANGTLWLNLGDKYEQNRLLGLPWRVALALQDDGWLLRSDIVWNKSNAMPSSVKNRPTTSHEYIFLLSRSVEYFYDADAIREPHVTFSERSRMKGGRGHFGKRGGTPEAGKNSGNANLHNARWDQAFHPKGRNKRTVWEIPLSKFPDAHFAVFPEELAATCISAGTAPGDLVFDPFLGSGTTGVVAQRLGRNFLGVEINPDFCDMARRRMGDQLRLAIG